MYGSDSYVIRLTPFQSVKLYGFTLEAKKTLTWRDVQMNHDITLPDCIECNIDPQKLYKLQPSLKEWIKLNKVSIEDIRYLDVWKPNPFTDFNCNLGDIIVHRQSIPSKLLLECKIKFKELYEKYGLNYESMILLGYTLDEWLHLKIQPEFIETLSEEQIKILFGQGVSKRFIFDKIKFTSDS